MTTFRPASILALLLALGLVLAGCSVPTLGPRSTPPTAPGRGELNRTDVETWLDGIVPTALEREALAGAVVTVVGDGKIITSRGYGVADLGEGDRPPVPVDPNRTLFRVGSISKLVTATAVMQQVEAGRLDLDADVQDYLDFELKRSYDQPVTLRQLLSHSAGYEDRYRGVILPTGSAEPDLRSVVADDQPEQIFRPGTVPGYSNWSNALAAYVVQRVTGTPYADYARTKVLDRIGMRNSSFAQPLPAPLAESMSRGYRTIDQPPVDFEVLGPAPAGALSATGPDLGRFMLALLGRPAEPSPQLLRPQTLETMQRPALRPETLGGLAGGDQMGLGFFLAERGGHRIASHGGDTGVFHSQLALFPSAGTGIFVSINSTGRAGDGAHALRTGLVEDFVARYHARADSPDRPTTGTSAEHAARAAGAYQMSRRSESTFMRVGAVVGAVPVTDHGDGTISLTAVGTTGGHPLRFREVEATEERWLWQEVGGDRLLAMDVDGAVVTAIGFDPAHTLQPLPVDRQAVLPVGVTALAWIMIVLIAWPIGAVVRRRHRVDLSAWSVARRRLRTLTHLGLLAVPVSLLGWLTVITLLGQAMAPPEAVVRVVQVITVLPTLALVPAVGLLAATIRNRGGVLSIIGNLLILLALAANGWAGWTAGLLSLDLTY